MSIKKVINTGKCTYDDTIFGFRIYASIAWMIAIMITTPMTVSIPAYPYPINMIGTLEINVPKIGIKPSIKTISESVTI
jgi:hypothetical protein